MKQTVAVASKSRMGGTENDITGSSLKKNERN